MSQQDQQDQQQSQAAQNFERRYTWLRRLAARRVGRGAAADVTQNVFTAMYARGRWRDDRAEDTNSAFYAKAAENAAKDWRRHEFRQRQRAHEFAYLQQPSRGTRCNTWEDRDGLSQSTQPRLRHHPDVEDASRHTTYSGALAALPPDARRALDLVFAEGCTWREAAERLELPVEGLKKRFQRKWMPLLREKLAAYDTANLVSQNISPRRSMVEERSTPRTREVAPEAAPAN